MKLKMATGGKVRMSEDPINPKKMPRDDQYAKGGKVKAAKVRDMDNDDMAAGGKVGKMPKAAIVIAIGMKPKRK